MKRSNTLKSIYTGFSSERKTHVNKRWIKFSSFIKRTIGVDNEFQLLLKSESSFEEKMYNWVSGHIKNNELTTNDIKDIILSLNLYKEELKGRSIFLALFVSLIGISVAASKYLQTISENTAPNIFIPIALISIIIIVFERGNVMNHILNSSQLELFLNKWLNENDS